MKKKQKKIVIIGGFGWRDIGDESMPQAVIYNLRKSIPDLDIVMLSPNPDYTMHYHKERSIYDVNVYLNKKPWLIQKLTNPKLGIWAKIVNKIYPNRIMYFLRSIYFVLAVICYARNIKIPLDKIGRDIIEEISTADLVFNNGGGNINSILYRQMYKQILTIFTALKFNIPVILSGQTIGPITKRIHAFLIGKVLNQVDTITFRDKGISFRLCKKIGINKPLMKDTGDDAISLPCLEEKETKRLVIENGGERWMNLPADLIGVINMNGYLKAMNKKSVDELYNELNLLQKISDKLVEEYNAKILFVPMDCHPSSDDRPLLLKIKEMMVHKDRAIVIKKEYNAIQYKSLIKLAHIAIGVRYHFNVFALSVGVPCIGLANGIYQKTKLKGLMDLYDVPYCFIPQDMGKVSFDNVWNVIKKVLNNRREISAHLKEKTCLITQATLLTINRAKYLLENKKDGNACKYT